MALGNCTLKEFPVDQKFGKTFCWCDLQIKILGKLQHIVELHVILNNTWSYLQVAGVLFYVHSEN